MGAWGPGIFSDDMACDVRDEYRMLLEQQVPDDQAAEQVLSRYADVEDDDEAIVWIALAATQSQLGRLQDKVKARAIAAIDGGQGLDLWEEATPSDLRRRKAALAKLRDKLTAPQPARRGIRRSWRFESDLVPGDVLTRQDADGRVSVVQVLAVIQAVTGDLPVMQLLDWRGRQVPTPDEVRSLPPGRRDVPGHSSVAGQFGTLKFRRKDADWQDSGFQRLTRLPQSDADVREPSTFYPWPGLAWLLDGAPEDHLSREAHPHER